MRILIILFALTLSFASGQELPEILTKTQYKRGIYKSFFEFTSNKPSILVDFTLKESSATVNKEDAIYRLTIEENLAIQRNSIWGVCDGFKVYVNEHNYEDVSGFKELITIGRYSYFKGVHSEFKKQIRLDMFVRNPVKIKGLVKDPVKKVYNNEYFILNINTGNFHLLTKELLLKILFGDKELYRKYKSESDNGDSKIMLSFIDLYNKRHINDAHIDLPNSVSVVVYRRDTKYNDGVIITLNDSTSFELKPNTLFKYLSFDRITRLCANEECENFVIDEKQINYIECGLDKATYLPKLKKMDFRVGAFETKKITSK